MSYLLLQGDAGKIPLGDRSVALVLGSPPYLSQRTYLEDGRDIGIARELDAWIEWMLAVTTEALRVSGGAVIWVASGCTKGRNYQPACEGLIYRWFKRGGECHQYRPCYWHRSGIPGNGGDDWFRADVEYAMCFKRPGPLPWSDNTAMGHVPKHAPGGAASYRMKNGDRVTGQRNWKRGRRPLGEKNCADEASAAPTMSFEIMPDLANPGNLIRTSGGHLGNDLAHENEAPYPEALAEFFVKSLCPPGGIVLDPFSGSGTTASVSHRLGRHGIGCDLRRSQCLLGDRRVAADMRPVSRLDPAPAINPLPGQMELFGAMEVVS